MQRIFELAVDPAHARVYEHGWQSWSPTTAYPVTATGFRPSRPELQIMCWRPERPGPPRGFQGEGLLAIDPGNGGPVRVLAGCDMPGVVPSIRAELSKDGLVISTDGEVEESTGATIGAALAEWADGFAARSGVRRLRAAPTVWCSWYQYFGEVTEADIIENLDAIDLLDLPVEVIQIDDGWQAEVGDWLEPAPSFPSLTALVRGIRGAGRRAGVWIAPFVVGAHSRLARDHPDWLVSQADAGHNWQQRLFALDVRRPGAAAYLREVFMTLCEGGFDYFKLDFLYAGALREQPYRDALELIRETVGPTAYLVGSGAPILLSVGLVDAMRVSPDIDKRVDPVDGDMSRPSLHAATTSVAGRGWQHGRFWINDPDCLLARPSISHRAAWATTIERYGGLRASGDRILDLDTWGLETTRRLLSTVPAPLPFQVGYDDPR